MAIKKVTLKEFKNLIKEIIKEERLYSDLTKGQADTHEQTKERISKLLDKQGVKNYKIMPDGTVNVDGDVVLNLPNNYTVIPFKFGTVTDDFTLNGGNLINLKGAPKYVGGNFVVNSPIKNLAGSPVEVGGDFIAKDNKKLVSLMGGPKEVGGNFDVSSTGITSLEGAPNKVMGNFAINGLKKNLEDFVGSPKYVGGDFEMYGTNTFDFKGINTVKGELDLSRHDELFHASYDGPYERLGYGDRYELYDGEADYDWIYGEDGSYLKDVEGILLPESDPKEFYSPY